MLAAQQADRIVQVRIQQPVMFDHRADAGIAEQRGAQHAEADPSPTAPLEQLDRHGRIEQPLSCIQRHRQCRGQFRRRPRTLRQLLEQLQAHTGKQDLRVDESRADIEKRAGAAARGAPRQREGGSPALEARVHQPAVAHGEQTVGQ